jgi:hypothetical protein
MRQVAGGAEDREGEGVADTEAARRNPGMLFGHIHALPLEPALKRRNDGDSVRGDARASNTGRIPGLNAASGAFPLPRSAGCRILPATGEITR